MSRSSHIVPTDLAVERALNTLLEHSYWPKSLESRTAYTRRHDDTDGARDTTQDLTVFMTVDSDTWIAVGETPALRFRTDFGGGLSLRTHNALLVLAEAIRRDNEERPQQT